MKKSGLEKKQSELQKREELSTKELLMKKDFFKSQWSSNSQLNKHQCKE